MGKYFLLKPESVGTSKLYLGGKLSQRDLPNGVHMQTISASKYIQHALKNLEGILQKHGLRLRRNTISPSPRDYHPEQDAAPECNIDNARLYASLIGIL